MLFRSATNCPSGPAEILCRGEFGVLVKTGDVAAFAQAMLELSGSPQLRDELSKKAIDRAGQLSVERMVHSYRELFLRELKA